MVLSNLETLPSLRKEERKSLQTIVSSIASVQKGCSINILALLLQISGWVEEKYAQTQFVKI